MIILTEEQEQLIINYVPSGEQLIKSGNLGDLLTELDDTIIDKGMDKDYELTSLGLKLQRAYDQIYNQN